MLDVYGRAEPRPKFVYPSGESQIGKEYVEPDFVIKLPGPSYLLVELERPSKPVATRKGQPRSEVNQAAFQIAEWKTYIQLHYDQIKERFPGIAVRAQFMIVIGRDSAIRAGHSDVVAYKQLLANQYSADFVLTYDDLIARAEEAYMRLASIGAH